MHTVVLIHGFGEDARIWEPIIPEFEKQYNIIAPDLPNGKSMEELADFMYSLLEEKAVATCSMIGHSMGGYITLAFAEKYPERLEKLGLFHSTAFADSEEKKTARLKNIEFIQKHGSGKFLEQSVPKLFSEEFAQNNPGAVRAFIDQYRHLSPDVLVNYTTAMMKRPDRTAVLRHFKKPVLFIMGEHDTAVPVEQGLKQCSIPEFSYIYVAAHSGHLGMIEETVFCVKALKDFLQG